MLKVDLYLEIIFFLPQWTPCSLKAVWFLSAYSGVYQAPADKSLNICGMKKKVNTGFSGEHPL
jgi:hypothetical protein